MSDHKKIQVRLDNTTGMRARLDLVRRETEAATDEEAVRRALSVFASISAAKARGGKFLIEEADGNMKTVEFY